MRFPEARALVTGGASGLGRAVAEAVARAGGRVAILDREAGRGQALAEGLGPAASFHPTDVRSEEGVERAVAEAASRMGGLSLAVSCAGVAGGGRMLGRDGPLPAAEVARVIDINLLGTYRVCRAAATRMQHNRPEAGGERGVLINLASIAAFEGQVGQIAYAASKGGIVALTLPLARELAGVGIRVVAIAPGVFDTPLLDGLPARVREGLAQAQPFPRRAGDPSELAALVRQVYENPMLNGTVIRLDGALRLP